MRPEVKIFLLFITPLLALGLAWLGYETAPTNPVGWFLVLVGVVFGVGIILAYFYQQNDLLDSADHGMVSHQEHGDRSFWLITIGLVIGFFLPPVEYLFVKNLFFPSQGLIIVGYILIISGTFLFVYARRVLRKAYAGHLAVKTDQILVQSGPYRLIRHPAYAGYLLMAIGISLGYASLIGTINLLFLVFCFHYRMVVEEKLLRDHFGEAYLQYTEQTKKIIPFIW